MQNRSGRGSKAGAASVGRNSAAHSALLGDRAYSSHAELSSQSSSRRVVFLRGEPARPSLRSLGDRGRPAAGRGCARSPLFISMPGWSFPTTPTPPFPASGGGRGGGRYWEHTIREIT